MKFTFLTLFPELCRAAMTTGVIGRAVESGCVEVETVNFRRYARDLHGTVDDTPYGGGPGMILKVEPIVEAVENLGPGGRGRLILTSPRGRRFDQALARELSGEKSIVFICGRYEGLDERVRTLLHPEEVSIGDFILTGGELAAMAMADAVCRLIPGLLGCEMSAVDESFSAGRGLLEHPQYTRPRVFRDEAVPEVLLGGNHQEIARWREAAAISITRRFRPDLLDNMRSSETGGSIP